MSTLNATRGAVLTLAILASAASILSPQEDVPAPDTCDQAQSAGIVSMTIMDGQGSANGSALTDYQVVPLVFGPQGGTMIALRVLLEGDAVPSCASFSFFVENCHDLDCQNADQEGSFPLTQPLATYEEGADRMTRPYYFQLPYTLNGGSLARLTVSVGSITSQRLLWLDSEGDLLAGADAGVADAGGVDAQASAVDAMPL